MSGSFLFSVFPTQAYICFPHVFQQSNYMIPCVYNNKDISSFAQADPPKLVSVPTPDCSATKYDLKCMT